MLRLAEEVLILVLDEQRGELGPGLPRRSLNLALAGAVLMDLAFENRIDTDLERLVPLDSAPLDDEILDPTLEEIGSEEQPHGTEYWLDRIAKKGGEIRDAALSRLIERGILEPEEHGVFALVSSVSRSRRYPVADGEQIEEVRLRIMRILFSDDVPGPRESALIALAAGCGAFNTLLTPDERAQVRERVELLSRIDLIGRTMGQAIERLVADEQSRPLHAQPKEIPVVPGIPLLGNALAMSKGMVAFLARNYKEYGPIFRIRGLRRRFICLVGPEANELLASRDTEFFRSLEPMANLHLMMGSSRSVLTMDGIDHVTTRRVQAKGYATRVANERFEEVIDVARREIATWPVGKPIDAVKAFQNIIAEQMGRIMVGHSPRGYTADLHTTLKGLLLSATVFPAIMKFPRFRRARARALELAGKVLAHKKQCPVHSKPDFLDLMLELREADPQLVPETNLNLTAIAPFLTGLDTTSYTCSFMLYQVLKSPELMQRMTEEADDFFERGLEPRQKGLEVSRRAAMETLRLYPVSPAVLRTVSNSFEFAGHKVPAGAQVMVGTAVGHVLEEFFPDPERFDVDRFTIERGEHRRNRGVYVPFGAGSHRCLGSGLVPLQMALTVATVLRETELEPFEKNHELRVRSLPTMRPVGMKMRILRRRAHGDTPPKDQDGSCQSIRDRH